MIDTIIGNYKITKLLGEGGMASVYEAEHKLLGTKVAIKVLNPTLSSNAQIKERFINEAKMMASLEHPNITRVIDFDDQPQQLSIVMEFLKGEDLNQKIKRQGALNEAEIVNVFTQTLSAFQYAHEQGIVHRDIKPSNIFILPDGTVKILDFGIAKLFGQNNEMTQTGTQMGTPIYMSPEQVKADKTIDHRSDIYSLGVTLYYALNGKPPYDSNTSSQFDIFNKIVYEPLTLLGNHNRFDALIVKACAKDREQRFQNCSEWMKELSSTFDSSNKFKNKNLEGEITTTETNKEKNTTQENTVIDSLQKTESKMDNVISENLDSELKENKSDAIQTSSKTKAGAKKRWLFSLSIFNYLNCAVFIWVCLVFSVLDYKFYENIENMSLEDYYSFAIKNNLDTQMVAIWTFVCGLIVIASQIIYLRNKISKISSMVSLFLTCLLMVWNILMLTSNGRINFIEVYTAWIFYGLIVVILNTLQLKNINKMKITNI